MKYTITISGIKHEYINGLEFGTTAPKTVKQPKVLKILNKMLKRVEK